MRRRWIVLGLVVVVVGAATVPAVLLRSLDHDPDRWHVDPLTAPTPSTPNSYRVAPPDEVEAGVRVDAASPVWPQSPEDLAAAFDAAVRAEPRVEVVAGDATEGWVTYVQHSRVFGFPDYVSVRFLPADGGSTVAMFSRSRFGRSDLGVNESRVEAWLELVAP